ncbi:MAG: hypothetical protein WCR54_02260 [Clostridia bacterium]
MKKSIFLLLIAVIILGTFMLSGCTTAYNENVLDIGTEGTFEYDDIEAMQESWQLTTDGGTAVSSVFKVNEDALSINTTTSGWAQASQEVDLVSNAYYKVEYTYTCTDFQFSSTKGNDFFFVSILEDEDFNTESAGDNRVFHNQTTVNPTKGGFYFKTKNAVKSTIAINVGTEEHPTNVTDVTISDIKLIRVHKKEALVEGATCFTFESDTYGEVGLFNMLYIILGGVAVLLLGYVAYVMFQRDMSLAAIGYKNKFLTAIKENKYLGFVLVATIAFLVKFVFDIVITCIAGNYAHMNLGYEVDGQAAQALFLGNYGVAFLLESLGIYVGDLSYVNMPVEISPFYLLTLALSGAMGKGFANPILATSFFIKIIASIADVGTAVLIYMIVKKHVGNVGGVIIAVMYALLPTTLGVTAIWGLSESLVAFSLVLAFFFMLRNNYYGTAIAYMVAFLTSWTAIILAPIFIFYSIMQFIKRKELRIVIPIAFLVGFIVFYLMNLPFTIHQVQGGKAFACVTYYWNLIWKNLIFSINAFNFQSLLGNNNVASTTESLIVAIIFVLFIYTMAAVGYFKTKNRMDLLLLGSLSLNMIWMFSNNMHAASIYVSLALMLIYAIANKEKRVYFCFIWYAAFMFVNIAYIQLMFGYSNNLAPSFGESSVVGYIFSALNLILVMYYIYIVYDIVATKKVVKIQPMTLTYLGYWKNLWLRTKKAYYKKRIKQAKQN